MPSKNTVIAIRPAHGVGSAIVQAFLNRGDRPVTEEVLHVDGGAHAGRW